MIYRRRHNALSRGEREWRVEEGHLASIGASGHVRRWAWKDFVSVRLCHEPTRFKPWRYTFEAQFKNGQKVFIDNGHYIGPGRFEERSTDFTPFVRALLTNLHGANPKLRALIGETQKRYFFLMLGALLGLCVLAYVLVAVPTPLDALPYAGAIKLVLILAMLPVFWRWVARAMPRGVALDAIPDRAFPPAEAGANS
ncbi:MAG TPA: hypothetical protein PLN53_07130 [Terricaulis sp.]|nr:hypothetical protein [Terricaulis sp.]